MPTYGFDESGVRRIVNEIDVMEPEGFWTRRNDNKITARVKLALADITSVPGFDANGSEA